MSQPPERSGQQLPDTAPQEFPPGPVPVQQPPRPKRFGFVALGVASALGIVLGAALGITADGGGGSTTAEPAATVTATATATKTVTETAGSEPTAEPTEEPTDEQSDDVAKFDQYWKYENGLEVAVTSAEKATDWDGKPMVLVTVRIKNKTGETWDADNALCELSFGPDGEQAEDTFRSGASDYGFEGSIAKGRSKSAKYGFQVPKTHMDELMIEFTPEYGASESALFEGAAK